MLTRMKRTGALALISTLILASCSETSYTPTGMCGGRPVGWLAPPDGIGHAVVVQSIRLTGESNIIWNGRTIPQDTLGRYLGVLGGMDPWPLVLLHVDVGANCRLVKQVRVQMNDALACDERRICGEGIGWQTYSGVSETTESK